MTSISKIYRQLLLSLTLTIFSLGLYGAPATLAATTATQSNIPSQIRQVPKKATTATKAKKPAIKVKKAPEIPLVSTVLGKYQQGDQQISISSSQVLTGVSWNENLRNYNNNDLVQVSKAYEIANAGKLPLKVNIRYTEDIPGSKSAYYFDTSNLSWKPLVSYNDLGTRRVYFESASPSLMVAIFNQGTIAEGKASWYDQSRYKNFKYMNGDFAAHRDFPKGTKLKITRLKTGTNVVVTVNDWGPTEATGRIIDLDKSAFEKIASTGAGEVYVKIEKIDG